MSSDLISQLRTLLGAENVLTASSDLSSYECDGYTIEKAKPGVVVFPRHTEDVVGIVKLCQTFQVPFVPRGAGTSLAGGTLSTDGCVMIALSRMKRILEVNARDLYAIVEPGVVNLWLTRHVAHHKLHFAPDPSSQGACTIGGNVSTNSGGPHTLKYGVTVNHILGLELAMPDGSVVQVGGPVETPGLDLTGIIVGAEGTFGVVTKIWVRLTRNPESVRTLLGVFDSIDDTTNCISGIIAAGIVPAALEMIDRPIMGALEEAFHFGFPLDAEAVLIMEVDGLEAGLDAEADRIEAVAKQNGAREVRRARNEAERLLLWKARKQAFGAMGRLASSLCTQDGVVPRTKIPYMLRKIREIGEKHAVRIANVFHAGDGNLHPTMLFDERDPAQVKAVLAASHEILQECIIQGGSVTGEHGIGVEKIDLMPKMFTPTDLEMMGRLRMAFNPTGLCNPGKMLPSGGSCVEGAKRMKGGAS
ncbi:MAG TPA: FAD-linked oxidase C-terminal domain-containing protein [Gemmatales bacterium]|nr:FAD-linked oxidase C-terminal domain-containing protein [Gemmatales bacterium]